MFVNEVSPDSSLLLEMFYVSLVFDFCIEVN